MTHEISPGHQKLIALCHSYRTACRTGQVEPQALAEQMKQAVATRIEEVRGDALRAGYKQQGVLHALADRYSLLEGEQAGKDIHGVMQRVLHLYRQDIKQTDPYWFFAQTGSGAAVSAAGGALIGTVVSNVTDTTGTMLHASSGAIRDIRFIDNFLGEGALSGGLDKIGEAFGELSRNVAHLAPLYAVAAVGTGGVATVSAIQGIHHHLSRGEGLLGYGLLPSTMHENRKMMEEQRSVA